VRNSKGESNPVTLKVKWVPGTRQKSEGSTAGNVQIFSGGSGYPSAITGMFNIYLINVSSSAVYPATLLSCCSNNSVAIVIPGGVEGEQLRLQFAHPVSTNNYNYYLRTSRTPTGQITGPNNQTVGMQTITVNLTNAVSANVNNISLVSTLDSNNQISVANSSWTVNGTQITFNVNLTAGSFRLVVSSDPYGNVQLTDPLIKIALPSNI
jgi:hypothetical protein